MVVDKGTRTGLPSTSELYTDKSSGTHAIQSSAGDLKLLAPPGNARTWDEPIVQPQRKKHWYDRFVETPTRMAATAITTAAVIAAVATSPVWAPAVASKFEARTSVPPITYNPPVQTQPIDQNALYRSNAQAAILQSVPELANYKSALDYTTQRLTDMKNVYGIQLDQAIIPVSKWVRANIDWEKKGERLVSFNEEIDFMPDAMFKGNFTIKQNNVESLAALAYNEDELLSEHESIWADIHDPKKLENYLNIADIVEPLGSSQPVTAYKSIIRQYGTFEDKAHWALVGRAWDLSHVNEELGRNEVPLSMILAVGGKAQIAQGVYLHPTKGASGDRQLAIAISPQLENAIRSKPEIYGTPIDSGYLQPNLPSIEAVNTHRPTPTGFSLALVYRKGPVHERGVKNATVLWADPMYKDSALKY